MNSAERPQDGADVVRIYGSSSPVALWNSVARQLSAAQGKTLTENARALALINMAMSDGAVATFDTKYRYNFWRPETAIRAGGADGNDRTDGDPTYAPYFAAPCFPGYPSAHATLSNAAREVMEQIYTNGWHSITFSSAAVPGVVLRYEKFRQITDDIDDARVFGGINFRFDQDAGAYLGRRVGDYIYGHFLSETHGCDCGEGERQAAAALRGTLPCPPPHRLPHLHCEKRHCRCPEQREGPREIHRRKFEKRSGGVRPQEQDVRGDGDRYNCQEPAIAGEATGEDRAVLVAGADGQEELGEDHGEKGPGAGDGDGFGVKGVEKRGKGNRRNEGADGKDALEEGAVGDAGFGRARGAGHAIGVDGVGGQTERGGAVGDEVDP